MSRMGYMKSKRWRKNEKGKLDVIIDRWGNESMTWEKNGILMFYHEEKKLIWN